MTHMTQRMESESVTQSNSSCKNNQTTPGLALLGFIEAKSVVLVPGGTKGLTGSAGGGSGHNSNQEVCRQRRGEAKLLFSSYNPCDAKLKRQDAKRREHGTLKMFRLFSAE